MANLLVVLISGAPGSGKTQLGRKLEKTCWFPYLQKDSIKEKLFAEAGTGGNAWSQELSGRSWDILFPLAANYLAEGKSVIIDGNISVAEHAGRLAGLKERFGCTLLEVFCTAAPGVLAKRFKARWRQGSRHPGHVDEENFSRLLTDIIPKYNKPTGLADIDFTYDTTVAKPNIEHAIQDKIRKLVAD